MAHEGIDISSNNHPGGAAIDYQAVAFALRTAGGGAQPFVFVKVVEGATYVNPFWQRDVTGFANAGCAVAGYIFDLGLTNPTAEYQHARAIVGPGLPLLVDAETPQGLSPTQYALHAAAVVGYEPFKVEYLNQAQVAAGEHQASLQLYLAAYMPTPPYTCLIHQFTDAGSVPGMAGKVDRDRWYGTEAQFASFFHNGSIQPTTPTKAGTMTALVNGIGYAWTPTGKGYWQVQADGAVYAHGDAPYLGGMNGKGLAQPIVAVASHPTRVGYVLVAADGGVFVFGAPFYGSLGGVKLAAPVVDIKFTPSGDGYALMGADGGHFNFAGAGFYGAGQ